MHTHLQMSRPGVDMHESLHDIPSRRDPSALFNKHAPERRDDKNTSLAHALQVLAIRQIREHLKLNDIDVTTAQASAMIACILPINSRDNICEFSLMLRNPEGYPQDALPETFPLKRIEGFTVAAANATEIYTLVPVEVELDDGERPTPCQAPPAAQPEPA
ncbi:MAG: hypothetical protein H6868_06300 [Rhodospirillales bacterium]|nr:hypothetical protein [Rhodospirillales bacterium]